MDADTPTYKYYADQDNGEAKLAPDADEPTLEIADSFLGAEVLLP